MVDEQRQLLEQVERLLESGNVSDLRELRADQRTSDIAEVVELVDNDQRRDIFDAMDTPMFAEVLEKVDEATMVRIVYNQPGWVRRQGQYLLVRLQGYDDPEAQSAVVQACQRVNQAQIKLISGHRLRMEGAAKVLDW